MESFDLPLLVSRWIHISSAIAAVGGAVFMRLILLPSASETLGDEQHQRLREAVRSRFARLIYLCIALLLLSGTFNFVVLAILPKVDPFPYHAVFGVKLVAALALFFLSSALAGRGAAFAAIQRRSDRWLTVALVLAGLIVLASGALGQIRARAGTGGQGVGAGVASGY